MKNDVGRLKVLVDIPAGDVSHDELFSLLIDEARAFALNYCRLDFADERLNSVILRMAAEDYGRCGGEGLSSRSVSGSSEYYRDGYSAQVMSQLRRFRRMRGGGVC